METKSTLKCKYDKGNGKAETKNYPVNPASSDTDVVAVAGLLNGLQNKPVLGLYRTDTKEIV